ncbi:hypothetical protein HOE04_03155 [archaeon]|jgi:glutamyl-tRNA synthetase|nr:hypothetical protein [archaeon]
MVSEKIQRKREDRTNSFSLSVQIPRKSRSKDRDNVFRDLNIIRAYALKNAVEHEGLAVVGNVVPGLFNHGLKKEGVGKIMPLVKDVVAEINGLSVEEQKVLFKKYEDLVGHRVEREGLHALKVGRNGIVTRFSPSASGGFHIGHALTGSLSYLYFKKYGGKFYVRIEDTNPDNSFKDSYKMIKEDSKWLFDGDAEIVIQSERMNLYYKYVEKLIKKGSAYVCECSSEEFKKFVEGKVDCGCRSSSVKENVLKWGQMLDKKGYEVGGAVLRFKSDMTDKNPAMRDFPLARINLNKHPLQGKKYRVWPLMNLAVAVDDIEMKMTHIIRAKDHRDNALRQKMIFEVLGKKFPWTGFLGRIHFKDMVLSTSEMRNGVEDGKFSGWDDVKLPTLVSLRKRGYNPGAFWKFAEQIGLNEIDKKMDKKEFFLMLDGFNRG